MKNTKEIRKQLKAKLGYNARQVSVSQRHYSSLLFTVRDASVDVEAVKEFANNYEKIDRCPVTFEILSGGNTFVDVDVTNEVKAIWAEEHIEEVTIAMTLIKYGEEYVKLPNNYALRADRMHRNSASLLKIDGNVGTTDLSYWICEESMIAVAGRIRK